MLTLRNFFDDITLWGWAERPRRRLVFASDVPRLPRPLPRALAPDVDRALMSAVADLKTLCPFGHYLAAHGRPPPG